MEYQNLNLCYETYFSPWIICRYHKSPYLCNVFFIVLDLRLTKVGARRCSFFYVHTPTSSQPKEVLKQSPIHPKIEFQSFQHLTNHIIFLKRVIKHTNLLGLFAIFAESRTFATVFFIVLDLRLTKVGARRCSFFYARTYLSPSIRLL